MEHRIRGCSQLLCPVLGICDIVDYCSIKSVLQNPILLFIFDIRSGYRKSLSTVGRRRVNQRLVDLLFVMLRRHTRQENLTIPALGDHSTETTEVKTRHIVRLSVLVKRKAKQVLSGVMP